MTDVITEKLHLMPYDDNYVLISKRRLLASSNCIVAMANLISGLTNTSRSHLISQFLKESNNIIEAQTQSELDQQIEVLIATYNQQPNKSA
jgi:aromatic ring-opening dioxygenase LigB subunit